MNNVQEFLTTIKRELLQQIILGLRHAELSQEKAADLASDFKNAQNCQTVEEVLVYLFGLTRDYKEALTVYLKYAPDFYEDKRACLLSNIRAAVEQGDVDNAVQKAYWRCGA